MIGILPFVTLIDSQQQLDLSMISLERLDLLKTVRIGMGHPRMDNKYEIDLWSQFIENPVTTVLKPTADLLYEHIHAAVRTIDWPEVNRNRAQQTCLLYTSDAAYE